MKVFAPGKLILSGEHAVVYGKPALAMAINRYVSATATKQFLPFISFDLLDLSYEGCFSVTALKRLKNRIKEKYQRFLAGEFKVRDVLQKPVELAQFALTLFFDMLNVTLTQGIKIHVRSDIPIGCGTGSSAATILSIIHVLAHHMGVQLSADTFYRLGLEAENMQHGVSSGLDVRVSLQGGCLYIEDNQIQTRSIPRFPMYLINTGTPQSTTGERVAYAASYLKPAFPSRIIEDFAEVTRQMDGALQQNSFSNVVATIQANHALLRTIGVVPSRVNQFIQDVEARGGGGKICGAGSVLGQQAGMVWVMMDDVAALETLCQHYQYEMLPIAGEARGVHVHDV